MNILAIGDVVGPAALDYVAANLWKVRQTYHADFVAVNAENAGGLVGPDPEQAAALLSGGADVLTGGNHTLQRKSLHPLLEKDNRILRPHNYPPEAPGVGYTILTANGYRLLVMNLAGRAMMGESADCPFHAADRILEREAGRYDFAMLDFHAEATGEKAALAYYLDGRVQIVYGTHTHVQTGDERILPHGTGYLSDVGMCGVKNSVLGMAPESIIRRFAFGIPDKHQLAEGEIVCHAALFTLNEAEKKTVAVSRITF